MTLLHMKRFKQVALLSLLVSTQIWPFPSADEFAKDHGMKVLYLALLGGTTYYKSSIQHGVRGIPEAFNINKKDFTAALQLFFAGSFAGEFAKGTAIESMTKATLLAHLFGVLITSSEWYNKQLGKVPVAGDILACQNADCKGACNTCKLRKLLPAEAVAQLTILASKKLNEWRKANAAPGGNPAGDNQAGGNPDAAGDNPDAAGDNPDAAGDNPDAAGDNPDAAGDNPDAAGDNPDAAGGNPDAAGDNPDAAGDNPDAAGDNPDAAGDNPDAAGDNPDANDLGYASDNDDSSDASDNDDSSDESDNDDSSDESDNKQDMANSTVVKRIWGLFTNR